jgi:hypothetical protein
MPTLHVETDPPIDATIGGPTDTLVYFLSLAFSTRYGSIHPLSQLVLLLRGERKINMTPLTTFADRDIEVEADQAELDRVWQDAVPLAANIDAVLEALASDDDRIRALTEDTPDLGAGLAALGRVARAAADANARIRLSFEL